MWAKQGVRKTMAMMEDGKMVVTKVLICGGLVVVVAYGIYACTYSLRRQRAALRSYNEAPATEHQHNNISNNNLVGSQRSKDLLEPLLEDSDATVGQTWRGSRRRVSLPEGKDVERDLESAVTLESEAGRHPKFDLPKDVSVTGSKSRITPSNAHNSKLQLEVIAGPGAGLRVEKQVAGANAVLAVGRMPQNDLVLNDPEVSGKHVVINWSSKTSKWELVDMGSLNGTLVNGEPAGAAHVANAAVRQRGRPMALENGDTITLGSTSTVLVRMMASHLSIASAPFEVGVASDAMYQRRGGRPLPMEDVTLCEWPLRGLQEVPFGIFCMFDGHGGSAAAEASSRLMPQKVAELLAVEETRAGVLSRNEASDVLRSAFQNTEEALDFPYEGCTATVLLVWPDTTSSGFLAQCANVGDSHCIVSNGDQQLQLTEDHRLTSKDERMRLMECGKQLKDGENRLAGMNIARALGDKFLKGEETAFTANPYISDVFRLSADGKGLVVIASDGLWDVLSPRRALQLAGEVASSTFKSALVMFLVELELFPGAFKKHIENNACGVISDQWGLHALVQAREQSSDGESRGPQLNAQGIARMLVDQAREKRTKDNTSVIIIDFVSKCRPSFHTL